MSDPFKQAKLYPGVVDTHFHSTATADAGISIPALLELLEKGGAGTLVDVAIRPDDLDRRRSLTGGYHSVVYSSGIHPSATGHSDVYQQLALSDSHLEAGVATAVGETGLDWYRMYAPRETQIELFRAHLDLARRHVRPVIIHNREADRDVYELLGENPPPASGVLHCFSSNSEWAARFAALGMYVSFAGNVTFRTAGDLRAAVSAVPLDRLLIETDAPFLSPVPVRGRPNHPGYIGHTYSCVAEILGLTANELVTRVHDNARHLFQL